MIVELLQTLILLATAPLATGTVRSLKARMQGRTGPSVLQPYRDLVKLFHKSSVMSKDSSWISTITPYVCVAAVVTAALLLPVVYVGTFGLMGDLLLLIYLLAIMKFFTALAALDAGSTFGGMGSSREMFISSIVEPAMLLSIFAMALWPAPRPLEAYRCRWHPPDWSWWDPRFCWPQRPSSSPSWQRTPGCPWTIPPRIWS